MKINHVTVTNWKSPGDVWWEEVAKTPDEPLIEATVSMTISLAEYRELLARNRECDPKLKILVDGLA